MPARLAGLILLSEDRHCCEMPRVCRVCGEVEVRVESAPSTSLVSMAAGAQDGDQPAR